MKDLIRKILRERWDWDSLDEAVPVPDGELKRYIIHSTNVDPRVIYNEGINPVCASDSKEWSKLKYPCVVFAMNGYNEIWGQPLTKGAVVIDTSRLSNHNWWYDPAFYNEKGWSGKIAIMTDEKIPADAIKGILCNRDLGDMRYKFNINTTDEEAQQYLDEVMIENVEDWSNDCEAKMDYLYNKQMEDMTENKNLIKKILKEETEGMQGEFDFDGVPDMDGMADDEPVSFNREEIKNKLNDLNNFLHRKNELGLQLVIDEILEPIKKPIPETDKKEVMGWLFKLYSQGTFDRGRLNYLIRSLNELRRVEVDGKWHIANKANTNYTLLAELLSDLLLENESNDILQGISESNNQSNIRQILLKNKDYIKNLFIENFEPDDLIQICEIKLGETDRVGLATENEVVKFLNNKDWGDRQYMKVERQGGDGDFIDMKLAADLIVMFKGRYRIVQVKTSKNQAERFKNDVKMGRYREVDILAYKDRGKIILFNLNKIK